MIGYQNIFSESGVTLTASSEATGFEKENAVDWLTHDFWKPTLAGTHYITVDYGITVACDYVGIAAHNLNDVAGSHRVEYSSDNFVSDINEAYTVETPADNRLLVKTFTSQTARYWRLRVTSVGNPSAIGVLALGARLALPEGMPVGFAPPTLDFDDKVTNQRAQGGAFLGRTVERYGARARFDLQHVDPAWVRSTWAPFMEHARLLPFFFSWDHDNYPAESMLAWSDGVIQAPAYSKPTWMRIGLRLKGLAR